MLMYCPLSSRAYHRYYSLLTSGPTIDKLLCFTCGASSEPASWQQAAFRYEPVCFIVPASVFSRLSVPSFVAVSPPPPPDRGDQMSTELLSLANSYSDKLYGAVTFREADTTANTFDYTVHVSRSRRS